MEKFRELLFLKNIKGLGNSKINKNYLELLDEYSDIDDLISEIEFKFKTSLEILEDAKKKAEEVYDEIINNSEISVITIFDDEYPEKLNDMGNNKPVILYVKGNIDALTKPNIAIVGTRKPSDKSQIFEEKLVKNIVNNTDRVVISGLALGCDKIAHQTTIDETGITIAILPGDVNKIKPASHKNLAEDIIKTGGCLISEYQPGTIVQKSNYVNRDKIVAAFSDAIFVVECGVKSGTMHTVDAASKYKRQIYAYLPEERPESSYDGNELIIEEKNGIKINDIDNFLENLETSNTQENYNSVQTSVQSKLI